MTRLLLLFACALPLTAAPAPTTPPAEPFWKRILRITGVSATPSQQKASGDGLELGGEVWLADVKSGSRRKCSDGGFRSPVFIPGSRDLLVVKDEAVWRMSAADGTTMKLFPVQGLTKLVGFDSATSDTVLALVEADRTLQAALLSVSTGKVTLLPHDNNSPEDRKALTHLKGWERVYGDTKLLVTTATRPGLAGTMEWTEIVLKKNGADPVNISRSEGISCGQPSLSSDGSTVAFIRASE